MRIVISLICVIFAASTFGQTTFDLSWNNGALENLLDNNSSPLTGSETDETIGDFAQLIWVGDNGIIDALDLNANDGAGGDDVVLGKSHIGFNMGFFEPKDGNINAETTGISFSTFNFTDSNTDNDRIYARFYNSPTTSVEYSANSFPSSATHYGDSPNFHQVQNGVPLQTFVLAPSQTNIAIPEPTTIAVLLMGLLGLVGFRKHLRK
jgi:hypothetical protein